MDRLRPELIAELACAAPDPLQFELGVLGLLDRELGADVSFFCSARGMSDVAFGLDPAVRPIAQLRWAEMAREAGRMLPAADAGGGVLIDSEWFGSELKQLVYYDTFMRPHGGRTTLVGFLRYHGRCFGKLVLGRCKGSADFGGSDVARLRALLPTLSLSQHGYWLASDPGALVVPQAPGTCAAAVALHAARRAAPTPLSEREREVLSYLPLGYT